MGLGRRNFLQLVSAALAGIAIDPLQSVIVNDDFYINKKLGILFVKPFGWGFIAVKDFGKLKNEQIIGNGERENQDEIWKEIGDPICIATKYYEDKPENKGIFSPTITLNITHKSELEGFYYKDFEDLIKRSEFGVRTILKNFKVVTRYEPYEISGCKFYEYDATYLFEHVDLKQPLKVELKVIKAEHNDYYYDFNCHQSSEQNQIAGKEFNQFKKSIQLI